MMESVISMMDAPDLTLANQTDAYIARNRAAPLYVSEEQYQVNTASGPALYVKWICFWAEIVAGVFGLVSMGTIWYFAPERQLILEDYNVFKDLQDEEDIDYDD